MPFGFYSLLEASILVLNAICILHEQRFLAKYGWGSEAYNFGSDVSMKSRLLTFITSVRTVMRIPLIGLNTILIIFKLIMG
uniref:Immediate early response 3-interacting protein 1 n=1 Tax=Mesocestoides corti TaxID=53468 RepID=A0A5K3ER33_MESCO